MSDDRKLKDDIVTTDPAIWRDKATALLAKIKAEREGERVYPYPVGIR